MLEKKCMKGPTLEAKNGQVRFRHNFLKNCQKNSKKSPKNAEFPRKKKFFHGIFEHSNIRQASKTDRNRANLFSKKVSENSKPLLF